MSKLKFYIDKTIKDFNKKGGQMFKGLTSLNEVVYGHEIKSDEYKNLFVKIPKGNWIQVKSIERVEDQP